jgi:hypothetical protein
VGFFFDELVLMRVLKPAFVMVFCKCCCNHQYPDIDDCSRKKASYVVKKMLCGLSALWGVFGVSAFLLFAIFRISENMLQILDYRLTLYHWLALIVTVIFMAYSEGYRGFQQGFSPRVAARVLYLSKKATWLTGALAPFFCMGYFGTTRRRQLTSLIVTLMILLLVIIVRQMPQPWRAIVDAGVVVGLIWGITSLLVYVWMAFNQSNFPHSPEISESETQ